MDLNIHPPLPARKDFRIGVLGAGFIVNDCHLVAYRKAGFNPVAIASRKKESAARVAQRHGITKVCDGYDQLLDDPSIEVLDIAVPPNAQLGLIKAACQRKTVKGILAQKPLGMNYHEAVEAVSACEAAGITLAVNQNMRYDQSVRGAKTLLDQGVIGEPVFATIDMRAIPHWMPWQKDLGWLTLRIMSIHHLDTFRYWFGDPDGIYCSVRTDPRTKFPHTDGICTYILEHANGLRCVGIDDTWTGPAKEGCPADLRIGWRIEGTNGLAIGDIGWCKEPFTTPSAIRYAAKGDKEFHQPRWTESWFPDAFIGTMAQLLIALETGAEPAISGRDNLKTMALAEAAYLSAREKDKVALVDIKRRPVAAIETELFHRTSALTQAPKERGFFARLFSKGEILVKAPASLDESFSNFTPRAMQVLALARKEADRFHHNFVGTEHLLLGLINLGQGVAVNVLWKMGIDLDTVRLEVEKQVGFGPNPKAIGHIPYTPRVKNVLALAAKEQKALNHTYLGTEHILLGMLREGDGVAARVLKSLDVDLEQTRQEILKELDPNFLAEEAPDELSARADRVSGWFTEDSLLRFNQQAQQALAFARKEADRFNHQSVATEHLLLAIMKLGMGVAVAVLQRQGISLETIRKAIEKQISPQHGEKEVGNIPYTPGVKKVLALAAKEAKELHHNYVGTEHILLGMLREGDGVAARVLKDLGVELERTRQEILKELDPNRT